MLSLTIKHDEPIVVRQNGIVVGTIHLDRCQRAKLVFEDFDGLELNRAHVDDEKYGKDCSA